MFIKINNDGSKEYPYSLSNLTGVIDEWRVTAYQGPLYWAYNGEKLTEIRKKKTTSI